MLFNFYEWTAPNLLSGPINWGIVYASTQIGHARRAPTPIAGHTGLFRSWVDRDGEAHCEGIESVPLRTRLFDPHEKRPPRHNLRIYFMDDVTPEQEAIVWALANAGVGHWYNVLAIVQALYYCVEGRAAEWEWDPRIGVDCIQGVADALRGAGIPFCGKRPSSSLTPALGETHCCDVGWPLVTLDEVVTCVLV